MPSTSTSRTQARLLSYFARRQASRLGLLEALAAILTNLLVPLLGALEIGLRFANRFACFGLSRVCHGLDPIWP